LGLPGDIFGYILEIDNLISSDITGMTEMGWQSGIFRDILAADFW
jgi:hypothetical protein